MKSFPFCHLVLPLQRVSRFIKGYVNLKLTVLQVERVDFGYGVSGVELTQLISIN